MSRERCPKEGTVPTTPTPQAPLSLHWALVVQLREGTALTPEARHGRVEPLGMKRYRTPVRRRP
jgi:hypothetical protein